MLKEQGKRLPTLTEYANALLPLETETDLVQVNHFGLYTELRDDIVVAVQTSPHHYRLVPGAEFSPRLYRGQNGFFSPCRPSLRRHKAIDAMFWATKVFELGYLIWQHPAIAELLGWEIEGLTFDLSLDAIAQHYGFPTMFMDFSRSKDVAMFFATNAFDPATGRYTPMESGTAVLYTVDLKALLSDRSRPPIVPLGMEPLPRPDAQLAFAVYMEPDEDLNAMPWIRYEQFPVTLELSQKYSLMFDEGKALFPPDPFDALIEKARVSRIIGRKALEKAISFNMLPVHPYGLEGVIREFQAAKYEVGDDIADVDPAIFENANTVWQSRRQIGLGRIRMRGAADHFQA